MTRSSNPLTAGRVLFVLGLCLAVAPGLHAQVTQEADLWSTVTPPDSIALGSPFTVTVGYGNDGPATANGSYPNAEFVPPMGLDVFLDNYWNGDGSIYDNLQNSATDSRGNLPLLFWDDFYCETVQFQVQGQTQPGPTPIDPVPSGESGSFTFETAFPMDSPRGGTVEITEPSSLAKVWTLTDPSNFWVGKGYATTHTTFATTTCDQLVGDPEEDVCGYITDNCWGTKVSHLPEPIETEFVLVDDGSANPTYGCDPIVNDVSGKIAVLERGSCEFGAKAFNAEQAGALGVFMVNSTLCSPPDFPDSDQCVINMGPGALGGLVTIPVIMVSRADGLPVIDALQNGQTIQGVFGGSSQFAVHGWYYHGGDSLEEDPNDDNDVSVAKAPVSMVVDPPTASFTYSPSAPSAGEAVQFTDTSTGNPTSWSWDFGDGGTSTEQNPSHTFASGGTYTVSLTATNSVGSSATSMDVVVAPGVDLTELTFIPAAALAAGAEGSFFQTDVDVNNGGSVEASFAFLWLPRGENNSSPTQSSTYTLAAGASRRFVNVLDEVFGFDPGIAGALAVISNTADITAMSRTYDVSQAGTVGTFGQALPGVPAADLIGQNDTRRIIFMSENDSLRANLGCVNGVNDNVPIDITIYDDAGNELETQRLNLGPWSNNQINQIFGPYAPTNGYADVKSIKATAGFYCYGSVLDNNSNDPTTILPTAYGMATTYFIPAAALAAGAEGSFFQTDVDINNAGADMATYQFLWLPRGQNNSSPVTSSSFTLAAGASVRYVNVLDEVFGFDPGIAGALAITSDSASLGIMSRTYDVSQAGTLGTFGQAIPGIPADHLIGQNDTRRIIFMSENDSLRANLGCVNGVNDNVPIDITTYDADGNMLETQRMNLGPWSNNQINQIFGAFAPTNGYADVTSIKATAGFFCYGSVLDNNSNDPTTILPQ